MKFPEVQLDTMLYQIERLQALGLLAAVESAKDTLRPIKIYQAVSDRFILPSTELQAATLLELFVTYDNLQRAELGRGLIQAVVGDGNWHVRVYRHQNGSLVWEAAPDQDTSWRQEDLLKAGAPAAWYTSATTTLTDAEAKNLQLDLVMLHMKYRNRGSSISTIHGTPYTLQLGLSPINSDRNNF